VAEKKAFIDLRGKIFTNKSIGDKISLCDVYIQGCRY